MPVAYYNWFSSFTGVPLMGSMLLFLLETVLIAIPLITFAVYNQPFSDNILRSYEQLYKDGVLIKNSAKFQLLALSEGLIHALFTFYLAQYMLSESKTEYGFGMAFDAMALTIGIALSLTANFKACCILPTKWMMSPLLPSFGFFGLMLLVD